MAIYRSTKSTRASSYKKSRDTWLQITTKVKLCKTGQISELLIFDYTISMQGGVFNSG